MPQLSTIAFLVENKPGVLFNVSNMFRRRGYNIESISVGAIEDTEIAMPITPRPGLPTGPGSPSGRSGAATGPSG